MSTSTDALGALGSDLAFSVSFGIARELLDAATDAQISDDELIGVVLALSIVLGALPRSFSLAYDELAKRRWLGLSVSDESEGPSNSGLLAFVNLLVDIARRISVSISVQLLAANVRAKQPQRAVRIVSLLSVAVFFLFLEATSSLGKRHRPG
tara:strand:- start:2569 stop:3027 length:459 start_codon:yes stop_codon:yes gene_type:complete